MAGLRILRAICMMAAILVASSMLDNSAWAANQTEAGRDIPKRAVGAPLIRFTYPTMVVQTKERYEEPQLAVWTKDDKYVILVLENVALPSALRQSGHGRTLLIWEVATGHIIHRISIPTGMKDETMRLHELSINADAKISLSVVLQTYGSATCRQRVMTYRPGRSEGWFLGYRPDDEGPCEIKKAGYPKSHNGELLLMDTSRGLAIFNERTGGTLVQVLEKPEPIIIGDADLSPDGRWLAMNMARARQSEKYATNIILFDIMASNFGPAISIGTRAAFDDVVWMGPDKILLAEREEKEGAFLFDTRTGREVEPRIEGHCRLTPLDGQTLIGSAHANCFWSETEGDQTTPHGLRRYVVGEGWRNLNERDFAERVIDKIAPSPDRKSIAVLTRTRKTVNNVGVREIFIVDTISGKVTAQTVLDRPRYRSDGQLLVDGPDNLQSNMPIMAKATVSLTYSTNGGWILIGLENGKRLKWRTGAGPPVGFAADEAPINPLTWTQQDDGKKFWVDYDEIAQTISSVQIDPNRDKPFSVSLNENVVGAGVIPQYGFSWEMTRNGGLYVRNLLDRYDPGTAAGFRTMFFDGRRFLTVGGVDAYGDSFYDTNLQADTNLVRWEWRDQPFSSFGPQTFMRDNFQPQLSRRYLECSRTFTCEQIIRRSTSMVDINTILPSVAIDSVVAGKKPHMAVVTMTLREGIRPDAANGKTRSGMYNLRLFRNGSLVGQFPDVNEEAVGKDILRWRDANRLTPAADGTLTISLETALPTDAAQREVIFTAYMFNEDRIKSDTATRSYTVSAVAKPRQRRAFVITIGIDAYEQSHLALQFAAADARIVSERLASLPDYQVRNVALLGTKIDGKSLMVRKDMISRTLSILAGAPRDPALKKLSAMGLDKAALKSVALLDKATPDDIVIISYAGHGWADKAGNFYLIPADGVWIEGDEEPKIPTLLSSAAVTNWLRRIDAGEIAFIIDACHAGASVNAGEFKPGPMGDPGLGQLAFDKGIRILAATQGDDVAIEDASKGHGLLTYALTFEGLTESGGKADLDDNGTILLDEWLGYGVRNMTSLVDRATVKSREGSDDVAFSFPNRDRMRMQQNVQQPSLFDFSGKSSTVILKHVK